MRLDAERVKWILFAGRGGQRLLNETAVQPGVWAAFAREPASRQDLLLAPKGATEASVLARALYEWLPDARQGQPYGIMPVQGFVVVRVGLVEFVRAILPMTGFVLADGLRRLDALVRARTGSREPLRIRDYDGFALTSVSTLPPELRAALLVVYLVAQLEGMNDQKDAENENVVAIGPEWLALSPRSKDGDRREAPRPMPATALIWQVSLNRKVETTGVSTATVKADAARRVFNTSCRDVVWAVIDSGIDGSHPSFRDHEAGGFATRVVKAFDFTRMRQWAAYDTVMDAGERAKLIALVMKKCRLDEAAAGDFVQRLYEDARNGRPYDWAVLCNLLETPADRLPVAGGGKPNGHGTHVAGILAGDWREDDKVVHQGVCPDLKLYDLRILGGDLESSSDLNGDLDDTEFAVISALEFVRWLNGRNRYQTIHGVNMSLGLAHDMEEFACGRTPVCRASDALVRSGVVVVAAAGNNGAQTFQTAGGSYRGYATVSITDPGNTESVITVGSTHRERPHEYGVSFFSSRGPTGDGRRKPDLVAPGEKIDGPLPDVGFGKLDGTSMAAPHVSGVAALLMARHAELIGQPMTVKQILVATATDLGRERDFQGAGLVDALRALQSR